MSRALLSVDIRIRSGSRQLYRVKHDIELGPLYRWDVPETGQFYDAAGRKIVDYAPFTREMQLFAYLQLWHEGGDVFDDAFLKRAFVNLFGYRQVICNNHGFLDPLDPRANYVTGENMEFGLPRYANLVLRGNLLAGYEDGEYLVVETLEPGGPIPLGITHDSHPWLIHVATNVYEDGHVGRFPQLSDPSKYIYRDVPLPLWSRVPVRFPLAELVKIQDGQMWSPYL